jgi:hypothetical protein
MATSINCAKSAELPFMGTIALTVLTGSMLWYSLIYFFITFLQG